MAKDTKKEYNYKDPAGGVMPLVTIKLFNDGTGEFRCAIGRVIMLLTDDDIQWAFSEARRMKNSRR